MDKLRVFIDADALFAASASGSEHGASLVAVRLGEITLIDLRASEQVITEVERNLQKKIPAALPAFRLLVQKAVTIVPDPSKADLSPFVGEADAKDLPILVAAMREQCQWLLTFNLRHYTPKSAEITVCRPGTFIREVRHLLTHLNSPE